MSGRVTSLRTCTQTCLTVTINTFALDIFLGRRVNHYSFVIEVLVARVLNRTISSYSLP